MRHKLAVVLTLLLAATAFADPIPVAPREQGASFESNIRPLIVPSGNDFVVIWWSSGPPRFARIRHADEVLLTGELPDGTVEDAVAGPNGTVLVAVNQNGEIHLARITTNGDVVVSPRVATSFSSMAWNGARLLIVTKDGDTLLTDAEGDALGSGPRLALGFDLFSSTAARGSGFVISWPVQNGYNVTTLTNTGALVREQHLGNERQIGRTGIGCNPSGACLLLTSMREPLSGQIVNGSTAGPVVHISQDLVTDALPPVWDGQRFLVAWNDYTFSDQSMHVALRVDAVALDGTITRVATLSSEERNLESADIARANGETVIAWMESSRCGWAGNQILVKSLATNHELRLTNGLSQQSQPAIAAGRTDALIAWTERGGTTRIRARKFPFTEPAFEISSGPASSAPVVGTDGTSYLVAWREAMPDDECRAALRITLVGSGETFTIGQRVDSGLLVTWTGSEYAVLWEQSQPVQLLAMRVDRNGRPISSRPEVVSAPEIETNSYTSIDHEPLGLFWTDDGFTLLWRRSKLVYIPLYPTPPPPEFDVRITRLTPNLVPGLPQTIAPAYDAVATRDGDSIVAMWRIGDASHAVRMTLDGTITEDHDLGVNVMLPVRMATTRTGYAIVFYDEILSLNKDLALIGRRTAGDNVTLAQTYQGLLELYEDSDAVLVSLPEPGRRRAVSAK